MVPLIVIFALLCSCASGAQTWPQVVDNHIIVSACTLCWLALMLVWLVRGLRITVKQEPAKGQTP